MGREREGGGDGESESDYMDIGISTAWRLSVSRFNTIFRLGKTFGIYAHGTGEITVA